MQKLIYVFILLSAHFSFANYAYADNAEHADNAEVLSYPSGCDYFIANGIHGYYLLKWHDGYEPSDGDIILGDIGSYGLQDIYYPLREREGRLFVQDYSMSESRAVQHFKELCD